MARAGHTASVWSDGRVLIAGGQNSEGATNTLEIFSPGTNTFAAVTARSQLRDSNMRPRYFAMAASCWQADQMARIL